MMLAYATLALCNHVLLYDAGTLLLGVGFSLMGAVPALHILGALGGTPPLLGVRRISRPRRRRRRDLAEPGGRGDRDPSGIGAATGGS